MRRLVRTYLVRTFSSLVQKEGLFFLLFVFLNSRKIFPTYEMRSVALIILYVKNLSVTLNSEMDFYLRNGRNGDFRYEMELQNSILFNI